MPKIIIREYDNTKANNGAYENFAVVVPGVMGIPTEFDPEKFDENLVCEVSSKKDFEKYIGKNKGEAIAPFLTDIKEDAGTEVVGRKIVSVTGTQAEATFWSDAFAAGIVFEATHDSTKKDAGYRVYATETDSYTLTPLAEWGSAETRTLAIIEDPLLEGHDAVAHQGNQIAYELCGLGYTVLFKAIPYLQTGTLAQIESDTFWECLKDKSTYDFRYITTGGYINKAAYKCIRDVATFANTEDDDGRGDCVALLDADENYSSGTATTAVDKIKAFVNNLESGTTDKVNLNKYCAIFAPKVYYSNYVDSYYGTNCLPATFDYLVCAAYTRNNLNFAEWYAVAGYNRGTSDWTIQNTSVNLGEIAVNTLQPRHATATDLAASVNVITKIRGNYYLWGNRTAHTLAGEDLVASHFLNIRQLCSTLKKDIWNACKSLTFDPNSDILWGTFCNKIKATLEKMKADQGIADYKIVKVKSNVKAKLTAKVRIVPIEAVEDFDISIYLEDSLTGVDVKSSEEE